MNCVASRPYQSLGGIPYIQDTKQKLFICFCACTIAWPYIHIHVRNCLGRTSRTSTLSKNRALHSTAMCCLQFQRGYSQNAMKSLWCRCESNWDDVREWQEPLQLQDMGGRRSPGILDCDKLICVVPLLECWRCVGIDLKHQVIRWYDSFLVSIASESQLSLCISCKAGQTCLSIKFVLDKCAKATFVVSLHVDVVWPFCVRRSYQVQNKINGVVATILVMCCSRRMMMKL